MKLKENVSLKGLVLMDPQTGRIYDLNDYFDDTDEDELWDRLSGKDFEDVENRDLRKELFAKCYPERLLPALKNVFSYAKLKVMEFLFLNMSIGDNICCATYDQLIRYSGASRDTVAKIMKDAKKYNIIKELTRSRYMINPEYFIYGKPDKEKMLLRCYYSENPDEAILRIHNKFGMDRAAVKKEMKKKEQKETKEKPKES